MLDKIKYTDKNVLLFHFSRLGDLIWMTSVFPLIKSYDKDIKITLAVAEEYYDIIRDSKYIDFFILFKTKFLASKYTLVRYIYKIYFSLKNFFIFKKYNTAIFMDVELSMTLISKYLFRIKNIYGTNILHHGHNLKNKSSMFYSHIINIKKNNDDLHFMIIYQMLIRAIYPTYNMSIPTIPDIKNSCYLQKTITKMKKIRIAICSRGSVVYRRLNKDFLKNLILKLNSYYVDISFLFIGSEKQEYMRLEQIKNELNKFDIDIINLCTKTTLQDLKYICKNIDLLISVDTAIVHIAAIYKIPTIALYSSSSPEHSLGINHNLIAIYKKQKCSPCDVKYFVQKEKCKYTECIALKEISVDEVFLKVKQILKK